MSIPPYYATYIPKSTIKTPVKSVSLDTTEEPPPAKKQQSTKELISAYIKIVTGAGDVDAQKMRDAAGGDVSKARTAIVEGYAGEFYRGFRTNDPDTAQKSLDSLYKDLNSSDKNAKDAATFALVASRFKNGGGEYNNGRLADKLRKADPELMAELEKNPDHGVGTKDVSTLGAVTRSIKSGKLKLSDVFSDSTGDAGKDPNSAIENAAQYKEAIAMVKKGDLGTTMESDANYHGPNEGPGNAGNSPNMASSATAGGEIPPAWGAETLETTGGVVTNPETETYADIDGITYKPKKKPITKSADLVASPDNNPLQLIQLILSLMGKGGTRTPFGFTL